MIPTQIAGVKGDHYCMLPADVVNNKMVTFSQLKDYDQFIQCLLELIMLFYTFR